MTKPKKGELATLRVSPAAMAAALGKLAVATAQARMMAITMAEDWAKQSLGPKHTKAERSKLQTTLLDKYREQADQSEVAFAAHEILQEVFQ